MSANAMMRSYSSERPVIGKTPECRTAPAEDSTHSVALSQTVFEGGERPVNLEPAVPKLANWQPYRASKRPSGFGGERPEKERGKMADSIVLAGWLHPGLPVRLIFRRRVQRLCAAISLMTGRCRFTGGRPLASVRRVGLARRFGGRGLAHPCDALPDQPLDGANGLPIDWCNNGDGRAGAARATGTPDAMD